MVIVIVICICCYSLESLSAVNHCHNDSLKPVTAPLPWKLKVTVYLFLSNLLLAIPKRTRSHPLVLELAPFLQLIALSFSAVLKDSLTQKYKFCLHLLTVMSFQIYMTYFLRGTQKVHLIPSLCDRAVKLQKHHECRSWDFLYQKESHMVWNDMRLSKWWQNFHFWPFKRRWPR